MAPRLNKFSAPLRRTVFPIGQGGLSYLYSDQDFDTTIVLLHGIPASSELWRDVMIHLRHELFGVYAPDLPGYGYTRFPVDEDFSLAGAAEKISYWIRHKLGKKVWVVGHDLGGAVAQILAVHYPEWVARLTLINSPFNRSWPVFPVRLFRLAARSGLYPWIARHGLVVNPYTCHKIRQAFYQSDTYSREKINHIFWRNKLNNEEGARQFARHLQALDNRQTRQIVNKLRDLPMPVQLIWGMRDHYQPWKRVGRKLEQALPSPTVIQLQDCGHYVPLEKPRALSETLINWEAPVPT
ncbi:MAG: alpha/beta hydrolase [Calditrichaeota bacterium]|nr:MAG: alpha/beta hydrolase [Calditrichota bacterium]